jgi:hypothetical protein
MSVPARTTIAIPAVAKADVIRSEIAEQIRAAKENPRVLKRCVKYARDLVDMDKETAEECNYSLPRKDRSGRQKNIEGPSVRFAEIISTAWGNLRVMGRIVEIGDRWVTCEGVAHDLENNKAESVEVRRRITDRNGRQYSDDMILTTCNAAVSIAKRNAILSCIPKSIWRPVYAIALAALDTKDVPVAKRRRRALDWFSARGVEEAAVLAVLGVPDVAIRNAIREESTTVEDVFGGHNHKTIDLTSTPPADDDDDFSAGETNEEQLEESLFPATDRDTLTRAILSRFGAADSLKAVDKVYKAITPEEKQTLGVDGLALVKEMYGDARARVSENS